jgi:hypothetical protein
MNKQLSHGEKIRLNGIRKFGSEEAWRKEKTTYMQKWRKDNPEHYRDYQREYRRAYRAKMKGK